MGFIIRAALALFCLILSAYGSSCATVSSMKQEQKNPLNTTIWQDEPQAGPAKAVVLLLHGLNLRPQKMDDWSTLLTSHGAFVVRLALHGHAGDVKQMAAVSADTWRSQMTEAMSVANNFAREKNLPLYFMGFSLGALVGLEWLSHQETSQSIIEKSVLIAPALSVPWYSRSLISMLSVFGRGLVLPSRSPEQYRANKGTTVAAYMSLFELKESLESLHYRHLNLPTLILIDRYDELVDYRDIRSVIEQNNLSQWQLRMVDNRFAHDNFGFRHLLVDEEAMGNQLWKSLGKEILTHFNLTD